MIGQSLSSAHISVHAYIFAFVRVDKKIVYAVRCLSLKLKSSVTAAEKQCIVVGLGKGKTFSYMLQLGPIPVSLSR